MKQRLKWIKDRAKTTDGVGRSLLIGAAALGVAALVFESGFMGGGSVALAVMWFLRERKLSGGQV